MILDRVKVSRAFVWGIGFRIKALEAPAVLESEWPAKISGPPMSGIQPLLGLLRAF